MNNARTLTYSATGHLAFWQLGEDSRATDLLAFTPLWSLLGRLFQLLDAGSEPGGGARQSHFVCPEDTVVVRVD
jgi:hypothetical protein